MHRAGRQHRPVAIAHRRSRHTILRRSRWFCAGRIAEDDIKRIEKATGARIQSTVYGVDAKVLGTCGVFEEVQVGSKRYNLFTDCSAAETATFILRGGAEQFLEEAERSIHGGCAMEM